MRTGPASPPPPRRCRTTTWPTPRQLDEAPEDLRGWEWRHLRSRLDDSSSVIPLPFGRVGFLLGAPDWLRAVAMTTAGLRLTDLEGGEPRTIPIGPELGTVVAAAQTRRGLRVVSGSLTRPSTCSTRLVRSFVAWKCRSPLGPFLSS